MTKPDNFLNAIDQYAKKPALKEKTKAKRVAAQDSADVMPTALAFSEAGRSNALPGIWG